MRGSKTATISCEHCGVPHRHLVHGGRRRKYCSRSCKDMHYQKTAKGKVAKKRAELKFYYSDKGRLHRAEYNSSIARRVSSRLSRKKSIYGRNGWLRLQRDNFTCCTCGYDAIEDCLQISHVVPRCRGGSNDVDNLRTACANCHAFITAWERVFICDKETEYNWEALYREAESEIKRLIWERQPRVRYAG